MNDHSSNASDPAMQITADTIDPLYSQPHIKVDEFRADPMPHRYVHGGFKGTDAQFSFYFPTKENYQGRFFHNTYPMAFTSDIGPFPIQFDVAAGNLGFTLDSGAYYVQTNNGGSDRAENPPSVGAYRANAAAAKYSRVVAAEMYGSHRPYGYLFGGSGGSFQVIGAAENTSGVWDGFLPFVIGTPYCIPSGFSSRLHPLRLLREGKKFHDVMDAIDPGGSGDPYATLSDEERAALREATLNGFPLRGWWSHETLTLGYMAYNMPHVKALDPTYVDDFWTKPGYLGADPNSSIHKARIQFETTVARMIDGPRKQIELTNLPDKEFGDADLHVLSGAAAGNVGMLASFSKKNPVGFAVSFKGNELDGIRPGDRVRIDNSWALAMQTYQRHCVPPSTELYGWNQYRGPDGKPIYPQRDTFVGLTSAIGTAGSIFDGDVKGKTLVIDTLVDIDGLPWYADWYRSRAKAHLGDKFDETFALWFIDHAQHDNPLTVAAQARTVSFDSVLQQGLRDLAAWAEKGVRPSDTQYKVVDTQVVVPASASERGGIQPFIEVTANGSVRAHVKVGEPVNFAAIVETPPNAGKVVSAEWDFEGAGGYPVAADIKTPEPLVRLSASYAYSKPGTYFAVLRAASQREGNAQTPYARILNIGRARVVVE